MAQKPLLSRRECYAAATGHVADDGAGSCGSSSHSWNGATVLDREAGAAASCLSPNGNGSSLVSLSLTRSGPDNRVARIYRPPNLIGPPALPATPEIIKIPKQQKAWNAGARLGSSSYIQQYYAWNRPGLPSTNFRKSWVPAGPGIDPAARTRNHKRGGNRPHEKTIGQQKRRPLTHQMLAGRS